MSLFNKLFGGISRIISHAQAIHLTNTGVKLWHRSQWRQALHHFNDALVIFREVGDKGSEGRTLNGMGLLYHRIGELQTACQHFETACRIFEGIRREVLNDETRTSFFAEVQYAFLNYVRALMRWHQTDVTAGHAAGAFHVWERGRARALLDLLAESRQDLQQNLDPQLAKQKVDLFAQLAFAQNRLMKPGSPESERRALLARRDDIELQLSQLESQIRAASPHYATHIRPTPLTLSQVQKQLFDAKTVLLEYALDAGGSYLWAVTKDAWEVYSLPSDTKIRQKVEEFTKNFLEGTKAYSVQAAYDLYRLLVHPAEDFIKEVLKDKKSGSSGRLIIVPDDVLHFLPFELLLTEPPDAPTASEAHPESHVPGEAAEEGTSRLKVTPKAETGIEAPGQAKKGKPALTLDDVEGAFLLKDEQERAKAAQELSGLPYLLRLYSIGYAPSATVLATVKREQSAKGDRTWEKEFIGFAPVEFRKARMLPHTEGEVNGIAGLFPGKATVRVRGNATKRIALSPDLKKYRYVHFATHGHPRPRRCGQAPILRTALSRCRR